MGILKRIADHRGGNFGMMTAILLPVMLGAAGFAVDITNAVQVKSSLQGIADSAALAAAAGMSQNNLTVAQAQDLAADFLVSQILSNGIADADSSAEKDALEKQIRAATTVTATNTAVSGSEASYQVTLDTTYPMDLNAITSVLGGKTIDIGIHSVATSGSDGSGSGGRTGISMYLALDRSGSMSFATTTVDTTQNKCVNYSASNWQYKDVQKGQKNYIAPSSPCYVRKIDALKTAATSMFGSLNKADTTSTLVRVGAVSYTDVTQTASAMTWGTSSAAKYVAALPSVPTGGTDATGAMDIVYKALVSTNATEANAHAANKNTTFNRFIVLMTDGEMTGASASWDQTLDKKVRSQCDTAKKDGIKIFTVAFMAPDNGKSLLSYCATSSDYYYSPDDMSSLVSAFGDIAEKAAKKVVRLTN
ncbi:TadE/TadG family type IV pilus assembly protein [Neorhizobium sp. NCHU2750]|uniref:vWA domain-containing protein n=1 Tax=Neorhizobium sp. NCHU2750 TaxID=1825976 RepID=UPI000E710F73|nr:hypothetical protein NCHU2750_28660 [Neorhizobium sp. NCHU2750]